MGAKLTFLFLVLAAPLFASPPTYGLEMEFSNPYLRAGDYGAEWDWAIDRKNGRNQKAQDQYEAWIRTQCVTSGCTVERIETPEGLAEIKVEYKDGFHFLVTLDPGILEAKSKPATLEEFRQNRDRLQRDLFDGMRAIGLEGSHKLSAGHVHIGLVTAFEGKPLLLRNFIADYHNHLELATGGMSTYDKYNAIPLAKMDPSVRARYATAFHEFDLGRISAIELLGKLNWALKTSPKPYDGNYNEKYVSLNLYRAVDSKLPLHQRTIEMRAIQGYESADEVLKTLELIEGRLNFLAKQDLPIAYIHSPSMTKQRVAERFWNYLKETGVNPEDYRYFLTAEHDPFFHPPQNPGCAGLLSRVRY